MAEAATDLARLGVSIATTSADALEAMLAEAAGNVVMYRSLVAGLGLRADGLDGGGAGIAGRLKIDSLEARPHVFVVMYDAERDRLARIAKDCAALGLDERRVKVAEVEIERLFSAVSRSFDALPAEHREAFRQRLAIELRGA